MKYVNFAILFAIVGMFTVSAQTSIVPYVQVNSGAWQQISAVSVNPGDVVSMGPQNLNAGTFNWTGPSGFGATTRAIYGVALPAPTDVFTLTYTDPSGNQSVQAFTITVNPTPIVPWIQVNGGAWQQVGSVAVNPGDTVNLGPQNLTGGSYSWSGPPGFNPATRVASGVPLNSVSNVFTLTYTNPSGATSTATFTITVNGTPLTPWIQVNGGAWQQISGAAVNSGDTVNLGPQNLTGGSYAWSGNGLNTTGRVAYSVPLTSPSNAFTLAYTNTYGATSTENFTITVNPTTLTPYTQVNGGAWQQISTVTVNGEDVVNLGPQPLTGTWNWSGPSGFTSTSRAIYGIALPAATNLYAATYTNASGVNSTLTFSISVGSTPITPWLQVNGGAWQQVGSVSVNQGDTVCFAPWPNGVTAGWGWVGPAGFKASTRMICPVLTSGANVYTVTYTNVYGSQSTFTFTATVAATTYEVELSWDAPTNQTDPVAGYHVYRATGSGAYAMLGGLIATTAYTDTTVADGLTYNYRVKSVDAAGVESAVSNLYAAVIP